MPAGTDPLRRLAEEFVSGTRTGPEFERRFLAARTSGGWPFGTPARLRDDRFMLAENYCAVAELRAPGELDDEQLRSRVAAVLGRGDSRHIATPTRRYRSAGFSLKE